MKELKTLEINGTANGIVVSSDGKHAYLVEGEAGLVIVDLGSY